MIKEQMIDGRKAMVAYLMGDMEPADEDEADFIKILFLDGEEPSMVLARRRVDMPAEDAVPWEEHKHPRGQPKNKGQFGKGGGGGGATKQGRQPPQVGAAGGQTAPAPPPAGGQAPAAPAPAAGGQAPAPAAGGNAPAAHKPHYPAKLAGEEDEDYWKRIVKALPEPVQLPEQYDRYFHMEDAKIIPLDQLVSSKSEEENAKGGGNAPKFMAASFNGVLAKRDPITVSKMEDGRYKIEDGNGTYTGVKKYGWKSMPVRVVSGAEASGESLFPSEKIQNLPKIAQQPFDNQKEIFTKSVDTLEELKEWLNKGKGVANDLGYRTMPEGVSPADVAPEEYEKPGAMLFIAPLKGEPRAKEKVENDYKGDWSRLLDVTRCTLAVDTVDQVKETLDALEKHGLRFAKQPKDRLTQLKSKVGYRDVLINYQSKNGMVGEIQLHVKSMLQAKNAGHQHYATSRTLENKQRDEWTDEDKAAYQHAMDTQAKLYNSAWKKIQAV